MDLRYSREVAVGTIVLLAIAIFVFGTMWLSGRSMNPDDLLQIQFADVSGLKEASPVRISGVAVGKVERIRFVEPGKVLVGVSLPERIKPRLDAGAKIVSISLVGDYAVDLDPGQEGQELPRDRVIIGTQDPGLTGLAANLGGRADTLLTNLSEITNAETQRNLQSALKSMDRLLTVLADRLPETNREAARTMTSLRQLTDRLHTTLADPALGSTLRRMDTLSANTARMADQLAVTTARLDSVLQQVNSGQGTLGRLAADSTLYYNLVGVTAQFDSLVGELRRNPGKIQLTVPVKVF